MLQRLILHIGMGKAGSTTIQTFLRRNRPLLRREGFAAFCPGDIKPCPQTNLEDSFLLLRTIEQLKRRVHNRDAHSVIWSLEGFGTHLFLRDKARIEALRSHLDAADVRLVVYLRRQDTFAASAYVQWNVISKGYEGPVQSFDRRFPSLHGEGDAVPLSDTDLNYYDVIRPWADMFGASSLRVRPLEAMQLLGGDLLRDFQEAAGLPDLPYDFAVRPQNTSFPRELTDLMGMYASVFDGPVNTGDMQWFFATFGRDKFFSHPFFTRYELPPKKRLEILEACADINARVARDFLGRSDGVLFREPWPSADDPYRPYDGMTMEKLVPILLYALMKQQQQIAALFAERQKPPEVPPSRDYAPPAQDAAASSGGPCSGV